MLGPGEIHLAATEQMAFAELFSFLLIVRDENVLDIAKILRACQITMLGRRITIKIPQFHSLFQAGAKPQIRIFVFGTPFNRFRAEYPWNPYWRTRLLVRPHPRVYVAIIKMLSLPAEWTWPHPGSQDQVVSFIEQFTVVRRVGIVENLLAACASNPSRH